MQSFYRKLFLLITPDSIPEIADAIPTVKREILEAHIGAYIYAKKRWKKGSGKWEKLKDEVGFSQTRTRHKYCKLITQESIVEIGKYLYHDKYEKLFFKAVIATDDIE